MFKNAKHLLNSKLNSLIAQLGHFDEITISDAGLPIPKDPSIKVIDLSLIEGIPSFQDVVNAIVENLAIEEMIFASEIKEFNPKNYNQFEKTDIKIRFVNHEEFKQRTHHSKAIIRTGEQTPYANVILICGVNF
ncbi:D-ribose pyranase [Mycoplasma iguanae]|uniref:D-ribose pyranase n=1 Tax=Mycoplasma iguanae TaxID=292461 RepID=A0ABY5R7S3_9MOLU|nr:D-ribose pyranase [Mycoplasma iguanae]UVD81561.1 D-ribose pyranase [Mycoplasma iguanae]